MSFYLNYYNCFTPFKPNTSGGPSVFVVWLPKHSLLLLTFVEWKVQHIVLQLFGRGPYLKQACYFISLLKTWAQLSSLIAPNKLKGGHCYNGYCCDTLTSKTQTQLQPLFTTLSSPCATECLTENKSLLLVAKHNHLCNVDGVAVEGASLQVRWKCLKLFLTMCYRVWAVIWRQLSSAVENVRGGVKQCSALPDSHLYLISRNFYWDTQRCSPVCSILSVSLQ